MKLTLVLMRHGEAEPETGRNDHGRHLTSRGTAQAASTGKSLVSLIPAETFFLVSDAARTQETFAQVRNVFPNAKSVIAPELYLAGIESVVKLFQATPAANDFNTLAVIGHNPGLSVALAEFALEMSGLNTADAAVISVEADSWHEAFVMSGCWDVEHLVRGR